MMLVKQQPWLPPLLRSPPPLVALGERRRRRHLSLPRIPTCATAASGVEGGSVQLTARERRQLRKERRESLAAAAAGSWREQVEERLLHRRKKRRDWKDELNLDNLSLLGPRWWVVRVSRVTAHHTADRLARAIATSYPDMDFKVYFPAVRVKKKLKNGSYSFKSNPLFPGCVFLHCVLNKELHDFVGECDGVGGFLGSKVGNSKRQINKPKPVAADDMEAIFQRAKREQEMSDQLLKEEQADGSSPAGEQNVNSHSDSSDEANLRTDVKSPGQLNKGSETTGRRSSSKKDHYSLSPGSSVRILCGPFTDYVGHLKQLDRKTGKATVGILMFGKETFVEVEAKEIVAEST